MPKYLRTDWNGCSISVAPIGMRRLFRFWPFFVGDTITFKIKVRQFQDTIQSDDLSVSEEIVGCNMTATEKGIAQINIRNMGKNKCMTQEVSGRTITVSCEGSYAIHGSLLDTVRHTVITFKAHPSEKLAFWLMGLAGIIIGALVGSIVTWLLSRN